jgi:hypothetical protein
MRHLVLALLGAVVLATGVACANTSSELPEAGSYGAESPAEAMLEEEEESSWRDAER